MTKQNPTHYRVLIVDDDAKEHQTLDGYLKRSGYDVFHAANGVEGMDAAAEKAPDLILLDIQMPKMDGFQMLRELRSQTGFKDTHIILMSFPDRRFLKQKGMQLGADDYIAKPFSRSDILSRINQAFRRSRQSGSGIMKGDLADLGLSDLLQSMEMGTKTASIFLEEIDGEIFINDGKLLNSRLGKMRGDKALSRIFLLEKGRFYVRFNHIPHYAASEAVSPPISMTTFLMDTAVTVDEIHSLGQEIGGETQILRLLNGGPDPQGLEPYASLFPIPFIDLMVQMEGRLAENLKTVREALQNGVLETEG